MSTRVISKRHIHIPQLNILPRLIQFVKNNVVMVVALTAAAVTAVIVPPDREYLHCFDFKTLSCLYSVLAVRVRLSPRLRALSPIVNTPSTVPKRRQAI